jgi:hypothetical protein
LKKKEKKMQKKIGKLKKKREKQKKKRKGKSWKKNEKKKRKKKEECTVDYYCNPQYIVCMEQ